MHASLTNDTVFPSEPLSPQTIKLSLCDVYAPKEWVPVNHYWPLKNHVPATRFYEILKEGLSRTMVDIPTLGAAVIRRSADPRHLALQISDDTHVDMIYEDHTQKDDIPSYQALQAEGFPTGQLQVAFAPPITLLPVCDGTRMITAKFNVLRGGIALYLGFNHLQGDAAALATIMRVWSMHTTDVSLGRKQSYKPAADDRLIRAQLTTPVPGAPPFFHPCYPIMPVAQTQLHMVSAGQVASGDEALDIIRRCRKSQPASTSDVQGGDMRWMFWRFAPESLKQLKKDASGSDPSQWISTIDGVLGLFWSRLACIRQASRAGHTKSTALFPVSIRSRVQPPVPIDFVGNAIDITTTECPLGPIEVDDLNGVAAAAQCIRGGVQAWSASNFNAWMTMATNLPADQSIAASPLTLMYPHNVFFNDYSKSTTHALEWGNDLGRIECTRYVKLAATLAQCATILAVLPQLADGSFEVEVAVDPQARAGLESDPLLRQYATLACVSV